MRAFRRGPKLDACPGPLMSASSDGTLRTISPDSALHSIRTGHLWPAGSVKPGFEISARTPNEPLAASKTLSTTVTVPGTSSRKGGGSSTKVVFPTEIFPKWATGMNAST